MAVLSRFHQVLQALDALGLDGQQNSSARRQDYYNCFPPLQLAASFPRWHGLLHMNWLNVARAADITSRRVVLARSRLKVAVDGEMVANVMLRYVRFPPTSNSRLLYFRWSISE